MCRCCCCGRGKRLRTRRFAPRGTRAFGARGSRPLRGLLGLAAARLVGLGGFAASWESGAYAPSWDRAPSARSWDSRVRRSGESAAARPPGVARLRRALGRTPRRGGRTRDCGGFERIWPVDVLALAGRDGAIALEGFTRALEA